MNYIVLQYSFTGICWRNTTLPVLQWVAGSRTSRSPNSRFACTMLQRMGRRVSRRTQLPSRSLSPVLLPLTLGRSHRGKSDSKGR